MNFLIYTVVESVWEAREKQEGAVLGAPRRAGPQLWGAFGPQKASLKWAVHMVVFVPGEEPETDADLMCEELYAQIYKSKYNHM